MERVTTPEPTGLPEWTEADIDHPKLPEAMPFKEAGSGGLVGLGVPVAVASKVPDEPRLVRPASEIRKRLRGDFDERVLFLTDVADGECLEKVQVSVRELVEFVECPNCGEAGLGVKSGSEMREIEVRRSATVRERREAMETLAKYGLGQVKEVSVENVRERVAATVAVVRRLCGSELAEEIVTALRPVWRDG